MKIRSEELLEAIGGIDPELVTGAASCGKEEGKKPRPTLRLGLLAAGCAAAAVLLLLPAAIGIAGRFGDPAVSQAANDPGVVWIDEREKKTTPEYYAKTEYFWPWEEREIWEQYTLMELNGKEYRIRKPQISDSPDRIGEKLCDGTVFGYADTPVFVDAPADARAAGAERDVRTRACGIYAIRSVSPDVCVAAELDGAYYYYVSFPRQVNGTLGELTGLYGLPDTAVLYRLAAEEATSLRSLSSDGAALFWSTLADFADRKALNTYGPSVQGAVCLYADPAASLWQGEFIVSPDGFVYTTVFGVGCGFEIGREAAGQLIARLSEQAGEEVTHSTFRWIVGVVEQVGEREVLVNDASHCADPGEGKIFHLDCDEISVGRWVRVGGLRAGDTIAFGYSAITTDGEVYRVSGVRVEYVGSRNGMYLY